MAAEELPSLCSGTSRSGASQRLGNAQTEDSDASGVQAMVSAVVVPRSRKPRDAGAPAGWAVAAEEQKPAHPPISQSELQTGTKLVYGVETLLSLLQQIIDFFHQCQELGRVALYRSASAEFSPTLVRLTFHRDLLRNGDLEIGTLSD